jgi:hypothetical protein
MAMTAATATEQAPGARVFRGDLVIVGNRGLQGKAPSSMLVVRIPPSHAD